MGILARLLAAFALVATTFNPSDWNYVRWATDNYAVQLPLTILLGLILLVGYVIFLRATLRSIGAFGMFLVLAVLGALIWTLYDFGVLAIENSDALVWLGVVAMSLVLGIGLSWSFVRRALSGQFDMDDSDN